LSSGPCSERALLLRQQPWFRQEASQVSPRDLSLESQGRTPRSCSTPRNLFAADGIAEITKAVTASPAASRAARDELFATPPAGLCMPSPPDRAWAVGRRPALKGCGGRPPPSTLSSARNYRPPSSSSSTLSAENLVSHEQKLGDTPRSSSQLGRRAGSQASSHSSRSSRHAKRGAASVRSGSGDSQRSAASAPQRIDWDRIASEAERQGRHRSHSVDIMPTTQAWEDSPPSTVRRAKNPGTSTMCKNSSAKDLIVGLESAREPYKPLRRLQGGAPPPRQGIFDQFPDDPASRSTSPYRRMRGSRAAPPEEKISVPLGDQALCAPEFDPQAGKLYPARFGLIAAKANY